MSDEISPEYVDVYLEERYRILFSRSLSVRVPFFICLMRNILLLFFRILYKWMNDNYNQARFVFLTKKMLLELTSVRSILFHR